MKKKKKNPIAVYIKEWFSLGIEWASNPNGVIPVLLLNFFSRVNH